MAEHLALPTMRPFVPGAITPVLVRIPGKRMLWRVAATKRAFGHLTGSIDRFPRDEQLGSFTRCESDLSH